MDMIFDLQNKSDTRPAAACPPELSIVVPCYNESGNLAELHRRVTDVCRPILGSSYELILVDDGSKDGTWNAIAGLAQGDEQVLGVRLARNHGQQLALTAGLAVARGRRILMMDADLQHPPEVIPDMLRLMEDGAEVVYGQRIDDDSESWFKNVSARAFYRLIGAITDTHMPSGANDFRMISRRVADALASMPEQHRYLRGMVSWVGFRQVPLPYARCERFAGSTTYTLRRMLRLAADAVTSFSTVPLRVASHLALLLAPVTFGLMGYALYSWMVDDAIAGWTSLMGTMSFFACVQLLVLGIMGEYLGRLVTEARRRPLFLIDKVAAGNRELPVPPFFAHLDVTERQALWSAEFTPPVLPRLDRSRSPADPVAA
ncbi:MAG TPA: glycosyltransferase family 2 protein [Azospirillaceae bacterium]|nr:glycosyltransferase family 2 protein [Azospirillaceae bacterium]